MHLVLVKAADLGGDAAIGETASRVDEDVVERKASASAQRAEPGIGEFPRGESVIRAGALDIGFRAQHDRTRLPVVAELAATGETGRFRAAVGDGAPLVAGIEAGVEAAPVIGGGRGRVVGDWDLARYRLPEPDRTWRDRPPTSPAAWHCFSLYPPRAFRRRRFFAPLACAKRSDRAGLPAEVRHFRERFIGRFRLSGHELLSITSPYP